MRNKRILSFFMAFLMMLGAVNMDMIQVYAADIWYSNESFEIKHRGSSPLISYNGSGSSLFRPSEVYWTHPVTGVKQFAYCVNPVWAGIEDVASEYSFDIMNFDGTTTVNIGDKNANSTSTAGNPLGEALAGAVVYGCPSRSATEVLGNTAAYYGVSEADHEWAAYVATKYAIWALVRDEYSDFGKWDMYSNSGFPQNLCEATLNAMKDIYSYASTYKPTLNTTLAVSVGTKREESGYLFVPCTLSGGSIPSGTMYYVRGAGDTTLPANAVIVNANGVEYPKISINGLEQYAISSADSTFSVKYPKPTEDNFNISLSYEVYAQRGEPPVLVYAQAKSQDPRQSYIMAGTAYDNIAFDVRLTGEGDQQDPAEKETGGGGKLRVIKLDARDNMTPLQGVTFDLYNSAGQCIDTGTTNSSGIWIPNVTESGVYTVIERSTNTSYQLTEPTTIVITVEDDKEATVIFRDFPWTTVTVYKEDSITSKPITGVQYEIYQIDGKGAWRAVAQTDSQGRIVWEDVPDGTYLVREVSTISGYILDPTPQYVTVRNGQAPSLKFLNSKFPGLSITKVDQQSGEIITAPATFRIEQIDGDYSVDATTKNGVISLTDMPVGSYKITELSSPLGYVIASDYGTIYLGEGESRQFIAYNLKAPVLTIEKIDGQTGKPIPKVRYELRYADGSIIGIAETGTDGKVTVGMAGGELGYLKLGVITVTEIFVPEPYVLEGQQTISLNAGDVKSLLFTNLEMPEIVIEKYDEQTLEKLPNAQFAIYEQADTARPVAEGVTDENGQFRSGKIKPGTYVVRELNPPPGYMISDKTTPDRVIVAKAGDGEIIVKVDNIKLPQIVIEKYDAVLGTPLSGFTFKVTKTEDATEGFYTTDINGRITLTLEQAIYTIEEYAVPKNYILDPQHTEISAEAGKSKTLKFYNTRKPTMVVTKLSGLNYQPVPLTTYKIQYENPGGGIEDLGTHMTDANGQIILKNQRVGWYILTEVMAAPGMSLPSNPVTHIYLSAGENSYTAAELGNETSGETGNGTNPGADYEPIVTSGDDYYDSNGELIVNFPLNSIVIRKTDINNGQLLGGAVFELYQVTGEISGSGGTLIGRYTTTSSGIIVIAGLPEGTGFIVKEVTPPPNYTLDENSQQQVWLKADGTSIAEVTFANTPYGSILIKKLSEHDHNEVIPGVRFKVTDSNGAMIGEHLEYATDGKGEILISGIKPGTSVVITEISAGEGWAIDTQPRTIQIGSEGKTHTAVFYNKHYGSLVIRKFNTTDNSPLGNAEFLVKYSDGSVVGNSNGKYTTSPDGTIIIPNVYGTVVVEETKAPDNFVLTQQTQTIFVDYNKTVTLDFYNAPEGGLYVTKYGIESDGSKILLSGAKFVVEKQNGERVGTYTTTNGFFSIPYLEDGNYICYEIQTSSSDYLLDSSPQSFEIKAGRVVNLEFLNYKKSALQVRKHGLVGTEKTPLDDCKFKVIKKSGEEVGIYTTINGFFIVNNLEPGWYSCFEISSKDGYLLDATPQDFEVTNEPKLITLEFVNKKLNGLTVYKYGLVNGERKPLGGITFKVVKKTGDVIGEYTTSMVDGTFSIPELEPGWYTCYEISVGNTGYALDATPQDFEVKAGGKPIELTFVNKLKASIHLKKISSVDRSPIEGVSFTLSKLNGERIGTEYKTSKSGEIFFEGLESGTYVLQEVKNDGYVEDSEPRHVEIKENGKTVYIEWENTPISSLLIYKTSENINKPLKGVIFEIRKSNGELIGNDFTTDEKGRIYVDLEPGEYHVTELQSLYGYEKDDTVFKVTVRAGKQEILRVKNKELAGLRLLKIDSITGAPIYNTEFMVFDANNKVVGTFYTDNMGVIDFSAILVEGRYTIRETRASEGYYRDDVPRTVEFVSGKMTEIVWKNTPKMGQIQITKLSADDNEVNGFPAGTPLENAIFEVYSYKTGNLMDRFVTASNGIGVSKPLPLGRYLLKEVQSPPYYQLNDKEMDITIEFATQIIKMEYTNKSANTGVYIKKTGNVEAMVNTSIGYDIKAVRNTGTVSLTDFYWRDTLPTDAVRLEKIITGTYNQSLKYKIMVTTNKGNTKVIADNLSTTMNNVVDCSNASLGLPNGEFVTSFTLYFGTAKAGFTSVDEPKVFVKTLSTLPNGYQFANKVDVGGKHGSEWVIGNATWLTTIYRYQNDKLPKTGW